MYLEDSQGQGLHFVLVTFRKLQLAGLSGEFLFLPGVLAKDI